MEENTSPNTLYLSVYPEARHHPYPRERIASINHHRSQLGNELFIDLLLTSVAQISDPSKLYPPKSQASLRKLLHSIETRASLDTLKKNALYYYLLRDYDASLPSATDPSTTATTIPSEHAAAYARRYLLPLHFVALMDGFWALDNFHFGPALASLTHPGVAANAPHKILSVLTTHAGPSFALAFVSSTQPALDSPSSVQTYFRALLQTHIPSAFTYARSVDDPALLEELVGYCLETGKGMLLVGLPLSKEEEGVVDAALLARGAAGEEARVVKLLHMGRLEEGVEAARAVSGSADTVRGGGLSWEVLAEGVEKGMVMPRKELA